MIGGSGDWGISYWVRATRISWSCFYSHDVEAMFDESKFPRNIDIIEREKIIFINQYCTQLNKEKLCCPQWIKVSMTSSFTVLIKQYF